MKSLFNSLDSFIRNLLADIIKKIFVVNIKVFQKLVINISLFLNLLIKLELLGKFRVFITVIQIVIIPKRLNFKDRKSKVNIFNLKLSV